MILRLSHILSSVRILLNYLITNRVYQVIINYASLFYSPARIDGTSILTPGPNVLETVRAPI